MFGDVILLAASFAVILAGALLFTNAVEWLGNRLAVGEGAVGSLLAAVGTAMPESFIPIVAVIGGAEGSGEVAIGAIVGAPFLLATIAMTLVGLAALGYRRRRRSRDAGDSHPVRRRARGDGGRRAPVRRGGDRGCRGDRGRGARAVAGPGPARHRAAREGEQLLLGARRQGRAGARQHHRSDGLPVDDPGRDRAGVHRLGPRPIRGPVDGAGVGRGSGRLLGPAVARPVQRPGDPRMGRALRDLPGLRDRGGLVARQPTSGTNPPAR